jgi:hypothetical protein
VVYSGAMKKKKPNKAAAKLGRSGGKATLKKYGPAHFTRAVNTRWRNRRKKAAV